jgi:tripartite-type tricarboxylate transporter receptor subunit TctC
MSAAIVASTMGLGISTTVQADAVSEFYDGKTVRFYIGASPGGGYDVYMRTLVQHMGKRLP